MSRIPIIAGLTASFLLSACTTTPIGPTALVMPAPGKPFEVFAQEQAMCKQFAGGEVYGGATMSNLKQLGTAAITTALGAGLGASVRGQRGAERGSALGAITGAAIASSGSARDQYNLQGRYDLAYTQCMYSRGNQVAGAPQRVAHAAPVAYPPQGAGNPIPGSGYPRQSAGYPMPSSADPPQGAWSAQGQPYQMEGFGPPGIR